MNQAIENLIKTSENDKIKKPDFSTRAGRSLLAFFLQTKLKQVLNLDRKSSNPLIISIKDGFLNNFTSRLIDRPKDRILLAVSGESASGKSTICKQIKQVAKDLELPMTFMSCDNYFRDISDKIKKYGDFDKLRDSGFDVDAPENFYLSQLKEDILDLQKGIDIMSPEYLVNGTGISKPKSKPVKSNKIVFVEGMCTIYNEVKDIFDIKIYVEIDDELRKERFLRRAIERNQDEANALKHWRYLIDAGKKYVASNKKDCDVIINGNCDLVYIEYILRYIHHITNNFSVE